jgi:hypothetical protein
MTNSASLSIIAKAEAQGLGATAFAGISEALAQHLTATHGDVSASIANSGTLTVAASASANAASDPASAKAVATGIAQQAHAMNGNAAVSLTNSGSIAVLAEAQAAGSVDALATASAFGAGQFASAAGRAGSDSGGSASFDNEGSFDVAAAAKATASTTVAGSATSPAAHAGALAGGLVQVATNETFVNGGTFSVAATAVASGPAVHAGATATGILGLGSNVASAAFSNDGLISVGARALGSGTAGTASANAMGYAFEGLAANIEGVNSGTLSVAASAVGPNVALANARGIMGGTTGGSSSSGSGSGRVPGLAIPAPGEIAGSLSNSGVINVSAKALSGGFAHASAGDGMLLSSTGSLLSQEMSNSGKVDVFAGAAAKATGFAGAAATAFDGIAEYAQGSSAAQSRQRR